MGTEHMTGKPCVVVPRCPSARPPPSCPLSGWRMRPPGITPLTDVEVVHDVLLRLSALVEAHAEAAELDLGPLARRPAGR